MILITMNHHLKKESNMRLYIKYQILVAAAEISLGRLRLVIEPLLKISVVVHFIRRMFQIPKSEGHFPMNYVYTVNCI